MAHPRTHHADLAPRTRSSRRTRLPRARGFTLIEAMATISILGILATMSVVSLIAMLQRDRLRSEAIEFFGYVESARGRALARSLPVMVRMNGSSLSISDVDEATFPLGNSTLDPTDFTSVWRTRDFDAIMLDGSSPIQDNEWVIFQPYRGADMETGSQYVITPSNNSYTDTYTVTIYGMTGYVRFD